MTTVIFANNDTSTLAGAVSSVATTLTVAAGTGSLFPSPSAGQYFTLTVTDAATRLLREIMWVTAVATDTFTVVRAQEGTTALNWLANDICGNLLTAGTVNALIQPSMLQSQTTNYAVDSGSANALVVALSPVPASFAALTGTAIRVKVATTNTTGATININSLGSKNILNPNGAALDPGQLQSGGIATLVSDGTNMQLQSISNQIAEPQTVTITATGAYSNTIPLGVSRARVTVVSAGGGGGGCSTASAAGGGGAGATLQVWLTGLVPGQAISGSVGALGAGGASGGNNGIIGGSTTLYLNSVLLATLTGGNPGQWSGSGILAGGNGGTITATGALASYQSVSLTGSDGSDGVQLGYAGGSGAPGYLGAGGGRGGQGGGVPAAGYGAGGGGAYPGSITGTAGAGGNGANGIVIIEYA